MKENEIIKALKCCIKNKKDCYECPLQNKWGCRNYLHKISLDLINRQIAEIEKYKNIKTTMDEFWDILLRCKVANRKEKPTLEELADSIHEIEVSAIKEFRKLVNRRLNSNTPRGAYLINIMNECVKEMEGEK